MKEETVLGLSTGEKAFLFLILPVSGAVLGWFIPTLAGWATKIPFIPFGGVLEWIAGLESQWVSVIAVILGSIVGIVIVFYVFSETLEIKITDQEVKLKLKEEEIVIHKKEVSAIYMEGKQLIFLGTEGNELFRGQPESKKDGVAKAFSQHWYPWKDQDPFENRYQRWVADHPDFPARINALLSAREQALKNDELEEAMGLRKDLAGEGVVIRDEDKRQYVRMVKGK